jgi:hypothetical protein
VLLASSALAAGTSAPASAGILADCAAEGAYSGGAGTLVSPYQVASRGQLLLLSGTSGDWGKHFVQTADIDLLDCPWTPIGGSGLNNEFTGSYDGRGYAITGLLLDDPTADYQGFFGIASDATLKDINLREVDITGNTRVGGLVGDFGSTEAGVTAGSKITGSTVTGSVVGVEEVGGLVGFLGGAVIEDSSASATVEAENIAGGLVGYVYEGGRISDSFALGAVSSTQDTSAGGFGYAGGLVGGLDFEGLIEDSYATGDVTSAGGYAGGLVGAAEDGNGNGAPRIERSYATGDVSGDDENVGGLVGFLQAGVVEDSYAEGAVTGLANYVGGLVGYLVDGVIRNSSAEGPVDGRSNSVGGLVGAATYSSIEDSFATGDVDGTNDEVGGLVGFVESSSIQGSFATGDVNGGDDNVGGLVGELFNSSSIERSYATGEVVGNDDRVGGLVGVAEDSVISASFALGDVTGDAAVGGLVGQMEDRAVILDSYARGAVTATIDENGSQSVGGLVGVSVDEDSIERSYATGAVIGGPPKGGLLGNNDGSTIVTASFWDEDTTGVAARDPDERGEAKSTSAMKTFATFEDADWAIVEGWDTFEEPGEEAGQVWGICELVNDGYPFLLWQFDEEDEDPCTGGGGKKDLPTGGTGAASWLPSAGGAPQLPAGRGEWQREDGSSTPLTLTLLPGNQVRYSTDGLQVTLTGATGSSATLGLVADQNGEIECEVCAVLAAGGVIEAWMFSTPRLVAAWRIDDLPCQRFTIPVGAPLDGGGPVTSGAHTLQLTLPTASGMQAVNVGVTVGGPVPGRVPAGDGPAVPAGLLALGVLVAAAGLLATRRQVTLG